MRPARVRIAAFVFFASAAVLPAIVDRPVASAQAQREIDRLREQTLVRPPIKGRGAFIADLLVPPGQFYDPLAVRRRGAAILINDDGGQEGVHGGRIWSVTEDGRVATFVEADRLFPVTGFDVAPASMGPLAGQLFLLAQPRVTLGGAAENHLIQSLDPAPGGTVKTVCTLPNHGTYGTNFVPGARAGVPAVGLSARFGPSSGPFANRFFALTLNNNTIYQATADGACSAFLSPVDYVIRNFAFSIDGTKMLVSAAKRPQGAPGAALVAGDTVILTVGGDGTIDAQPLATLRGAAVQAMAVAPATFGLYAGQLFVSTSGSQAGEEEERDPAASSRKANAKIYYFDRLGKAHMAASGFYTPFDLEFVNDSLWVVDINRDYQSGFYLPDGFLVRIRRR
jgi:hypothetical protein